MDQHKQNEDKNDQYSFYSEKSKKLMEKMGFKGKGLGVNEQGIQAPLDLKQKISNKGIGLKDDSLPSNFKSQKHELDIDDYPHEQKISYLSYQESKDFNFDKCYVIGLDEESIKLPCATDDIQKKIENLKSEFDELDGKLFRDARFRTNPYERIGTSIFQNRAALKMANLDQICELTHVKRKDEEKNVLYFADICAGPGGFTEYIYWKYKTFGAKGWGFTLKGSEDFDLNKFNSESPHDNFDLCYGKDGTGDITKSENILDFSSVIDLATNQRGLALVTADGGFSVKGNENQQEKILGQLVLCQFLTALNILRKGGNFMCKIFDIFSPFTVGLIYILYQTFEKFAIIKPFTSRPANSERYVIGIGLKERRPKVVEYMFKVNQMINEKKNVTSVVNIDILKGDETFMNYVKESNIELGNRQIKALETIKKGVEDKYYDTKSIQEDLEKRCLALWNVPLEQRKEKRRRGRNERNDSRTSYERSDNRYERNERYNDNRYESRSSDRYDSRDNRYYNDRYDYRPNNRYSDNRYEYRDNRYDRYEDNRSRDYERRDYQRSYERPRYEHDYYRERGEKRERSPEKEINGSKKTKE